jgi:ADP-ribose pyrophosphatase
MKVLSSEVRFDSPVFTVTDDRVVEPGGKEVHRSIVRHSGSAVVLALDAAGRVLVVEQFRLPARDVLWELPAGRVDPGESALEAARRELREETGYAAEEWRELITFYPSPGFVDEKMTVFLAHDLTEGAAEPMEDETIETHWLTVDEMEERIQSGKIRDGKTLVGFLYWQRFGAGQEETATVPDLQLGR